MKRRDERAADEMAVRPSHFRVERLEPGKLQPDMGAGREVEVGGSAKAVGRQIEQLDAHAARAALPEAGIEVDLLAFGLSSAFGGDEAEPGIECDRSR